MGIDKVSQWIINCDEDGCWEMEEVIWGDSSVFNKAQAIKEFRYRGWKIGTKCKCPECSHKNEQTKHLNTKVYT